MLDKLDINYSFICKCDNSFSKILVTLLNKETGESTSILRLMNFSTIEPIILLDDIINDGYFGNMSVDEFVNCYSSYCLNDSFEYFKEYKELSILHSKLEKVLGLDYYNVWNGN